MLSKCLLLLLPVVAASCHLAPTGSESPAGNATVCVAQTEQQLRDIAGRRVVDCRVDIYESELTTLDALIGLEESPEISLSSNRQLVDLSALRSISKLGSLNIMSAWADELQLGDLDVASLHIAAFSSPGLRIIASNQTEMVGIELRSNHRIEALTFPNLLSLRALAVWNNSGLTSLASFNGVTTIVALHVHGNHGLVGIGLSDNLVVTQEIFIFDNPDLPRAEVDTFIERVRTNGFDGRVVVCGNKDDEPC